MPPDVLFLVGLTTKMVVTASIVVAASYLAERVGPAIAASIITLPVAVGPAYVILGIEHDSAFVAASALGTLVSNVAGLTFIFSYVLLSRRHGLLASLGIATLAWCAVILGLRLLPWTISYALLANVVIYAIALIATLQVKRDAPRSKPTLRRWYDLPFRAGVVGIAVATVTTLSHTIGSFYTGVLAVFPVALFSMAVILHPRLGGPAAGALFADALIPLVGFVMSISLVHLTAEAWGVWTSLTVALAMNVMWNLAVWQVRHRAALKPA